MQRTIMLEEQVNQQREARARKTIKEDQRRVSSITSKGQTPRFSTQGTSKNLALVPYRLKTWKRASLKARRLDTGDS